MISLADRARRSRRGLRALADDRFRLVRDIAPRLTDCLRHGGASRVGIRVRVHLHLRDSHAFRSERISAGEFGAHHLELAHGSSCEVRPAPLAERRRIELHHPLHRQRLLRQQIAAAQ